MSVYKCQIIRFQYLGSRGAQLPPFCHAPLSQQVSILGLARSPTPCFGTCLVCTSGFNTWAREEPNRTVVNPSGLSTSFNTWAREEPNETRSRLKNGLTRFQYLGSRGAQLGLQKRRETVGRFNTWAREEPNATRRFRRYDSCTVSILGLARSPTVAIAISACILTVSILGLARSPTSGVPLSYSGLQGFQYLGSRGAQRHHHHGQWCLYAVSILGLARSPTLLI